MGTTRCARAPSYSNEASRTAVFQITLRFIYVGAATPGGCVVILLRVDSSVDERLNSAPKMMFNHRADCVFRWMNGQHLRALPVEEVAPMVGSALVEADVCKDSGGSFAMGAAALVQGSLELVNDAVSQTRDVLEYKV